MMPSATSLGGCAVLLGLLFTPARADSVYGNDPLIVDILVLNFDPLVAGGRTPSPLHSYAGWQAPRALADNYIANVREASGGFVQYRVAEWRDLDDIPTKIDNYDYTTAEYVANLSSGNWHSPDTADYGRVP